MAKADVFRTFLVIMGKVHNRSHSGLFSHLVVANSCCRVLQGVVKRLTPRNQAARNMPILENPR
jgi:hypothetical protein